MKAAKIRVIVAAVLLAGWITYLGYLAATTSNPVVLSRPQFLASSAVIVGTVESKNGKPDAKVVIEDVKRDASNSLKAGQTIEVRFAPKGETPGGWEGSGSYILALSKGQGGYSVTKLPPSPGFPGKDGSESPEFMYRIYPQTSDTMQQLESLTDSQ
jgi:hypothetical protein